MKAPVYVVKPKYIFKHPFNKYDLSNPTNRYTQNEYLTDYFNYGFNEDTMTAYGKLVKRTIEVLDQRHNLYYFNYPSYLMRLNDYIPMDFGGFCKFHDISLLNTGNNDNMHTGYSLMYYFIMVAFTMSNSTNVKRTDFPLIEFVKRMYEPAEGDDSRDNILFENIEQIGRNIEKKYYETLVKLKQKLAEHKPVNRKFANNRGQQYQNQQQVEQRSQIAEYVKYVKYEKRYVKEESSYSSSESSESHRRSSSKDRHKKHKKEKKKKDKDKKRKYSKSKKVKKEKKKKSKSRSRSRSRDRDRKKH